MTTPAFLITGIDPATMSQATLGLELDFPGSVAITASVSAEEETLQWVLSNLSGAFDHDSTDLSGCCVNCSTRDELLALMERLAATGRYSAIIAQLPQGIPARPICGRVHAPSADYSFHIAGVIAAIDGTDLEFCLTGDELLRERHSDTLPDDARGVAEVNCHFIEYADLVMVSPPFTDDEEQRESLQEGLHLIHAIVRPETQVSVNWPGLDASACEGLHQHHASEEFVDEVQHAPLPSGTASVWSLILESDRPLHPGRLLENVERLGMGTFRSRGYFAVASRPFQRCAWDGAGGQLSVGLQNTDKFSPTNTRIIMTGLVAHGDVRQRIRDAFNDTLLTDDELTERGALWEVWEDGLEPWLGPVRSLNSAR